MVPGREKWRAAVVSNRSFKTKAGRNRARIFHTRIALVIEKSHCETGINRNLVRISFRPGDLVQAEACQQAGFVRNTVIDSDGKLVGTGVNLGGRFVGPRADAPVGLLGKG